uniref:Putative ankyrin repeat protein SKIP35-like n=1 Tax=Davidia involucrata TaxID=16924 RepID=A0A5B7B624_DAVIN
MEDEKTLNCLQLAGNDPRDPSCAQMDTDETGNGSRNNELAVVTSEKGEGCNVVLSIETPLVGKDPTMSGGCSCDLKKLKSRMVTADSGIGKNEKIGHEKKLNRQDRIELGRLFQGAVSSHNCELAESLILLADPQTLNDAGS